jgi:lipid II:glycine glycyltransferase (peptidoglycan interpeptide bridge formation enzyme)
LDTDEIEAEIKAAITDVTEQVASLQNRLENLGSDEVNLEAKIEKKKTDFERMQNRLKRMLSQR